MLKQHLRYEAALHLDNSESIARFAARYAGLGRTPESMNREFDNYDRLTPEDIQRAARKYLVEKNRTIVSLSSVGGGN
jgi:zinc protease